MASLYPPSAVVEMKDGYMTLKIYGCRTMYANVNSPRLHKDTRAPKSYDCEFLLDKNGSGVTAAIDIIRKAALAKFGGPTGWENHLIKNGDRLIADIIEKGGEVPEAMKNYAGMWVIKPSTGADKPPRVQGVVYSGCYAGAAIGVKPFDFIDKDGNPVKGLKGYMNMVQFHGDGERLGRADLPVEDVMGVPPAQQETAPHPDDDFGAGAHTAPPRSSNPGDDSDLPF